MGVAAGLCFGHKGRVKHCFETYRIVSVNPTVMVPSVSQGYDDTASGDDMENLVIFSVLTKFGGAITGPFLVEY